MKWLLMVVAFVLGAAITWFLTVKRVTRSVPVGDQAAAVAPEPEIAPVVSPGGPVAGAVGVAGGADLVATVGAGVLATEAAGASDDEDQDEDEASRFGGAHTPASEAPGAAEAWDRDAEDEDALLPGVGVQTPDGGESARTAADAEQESAEASTLPVVGATLNGDLAGVGSPATVAEIDGHVEAQSSEAAPAADAELTSNEPDADTSTGSDVDVAPVTNPTGDVAGASPPLHEQGELTFDDEPEQSVPPEDRPGGNAV